MPYLNAADELKTKPTQHSVKELLSIGIQPDILVCRADRHLPEEMRRKIALFCNVEERAVIPARTVDTIYEVPLRLAAEGLDEILLELLNLPARAARPREVADGRRPAPQPRAATSASASSASTSTSATLQVAQRGAAATAASPTTPRSSWCSSTPRSSRRRRTSRSCSRSTAILVPGGFGKRGIEGMIRAIEFARGHKIPYFGICLGLQTAVIEFARNVCDLERANSSEFAPDPPYKVIYKMRELVGVDAMGGTMRLGKYPCQLKPGSRAWEAYRADTVWERHRHRYEVNPDYVPLLEQHGLRVTGRSPDRIFVEMIEVPDHPWFVGVPVPPRAEVQAVRAAPAVRRLRQGRARASGPAADRAERPRRPGRATAVHAVRRRAS